MAPYLDVFQSAHLFRHHPFAVDISLVFESYLRSFGYLFAAVVGRFEQSLQLGQLLGGVGNGYLRSAEDIDEWTAAVEWGSAQAFEHGVHLGCLHMGVFTVVNDAVYGLFLLQPPVQSRGVCQTDGMGFFGKTFVCIILSEQHAVFGARSEHSVGLVYALRHQVVDKHADITLVATEHERCATAAADGRIGAGHQSLSCRLLIACGAVHLSSEEQAADDLRFQRVV